MSLWKKIFGGSSEPKARSISRVEDLKPNDMITLNDSFALPELLRGKQFEVQSVDTYDYDGDKESEWVLVGTDGTQVFLSIDEDDEKYLVFSVKITREEVETLFDLNEFSRVFDAQGMVSLDVQSEIARLPGWISGTYHRQGTFETGTYHRGGTCKGETFELYELLDSDEEKGVCIEVWGSGETDVSLVLYRPTTDVVDFFAAK